MPIIHYTFQSGRKKLRNFYKINSFLMVERGIFEGLNIHDS